MSHLLVPITVDAVVLGADQTVVGPEMDFSSLPYFDATLGLDVNPDSPYLAESIASRPFENESFVLSKGVHLNWDLPRFLKSGKARPDAAPDFPPVPTRWLVARYSSAADRARGRAPEESWIVESDLVLEQLQGKRFDLMAQTSLEVDIHGGARPYSYMGHSGTLAEWVARSGETPASWTTWRATHQDKPLTALGWGSLAFDVFYPNCRGVFGFHDPAVTEIGSDPPVYVVVGWYEQSGDDRWRTYLEHDEPGASPAGLADRGHLSDSRKDDLWKKSIQKALADELGISLDALDRADGSVTDLAAVLPSEGMLCAGVVVPPAAPSPAPAAAGAAKVAIGNTPIEALTAMVVGEAFSDLAGPHRERMEDMLTAALMGDQLQSLTVDVGPQYRGLRHRDSFVASRGGLVWNVRGSEERPSGAAASPAGAGPATAAPDSGAAGTAATAKRSVPPLPGEIASLLDTLNRAQRAYDEAAFKLESRRTELYADWCRYMRCAYPPAEETDAFVAQGQMASWIRYGSLNRYGSEKLALGRELDCEAWASTPPTAVGDSSLADAVITAWTALYERLGQINGEMPEEARFHWLLQPTPAPRFWEPAPPAVVLALPRAAGSGTGSSSGGSQPPAPGAAPPRESELLSCTAFTGTIDLEPAAFDVDTLLAAAVEHPAAEAAGPFSADWQVELFPEAAMHRISQPGGSYDPQYILHNYSLGENATDLADDEGLGGPVGVVKASAVYAGRCFVNPRVGARYRELLHGFLELAGTGTTHAADVAKAKTFLDTHDLLAVTLNGFNSALLQRHETTQLNPADPLGFADFRAFAEEVSAALPGGKAYAPDPGVEFLPLRSGALRLQALRLIDTFGRVTPVEPAAVHRPLPMQILDHPDWVRLPPRLSQPARFDLAFLRRDGGAEPTCDSLPDHSPVRGWLVPNLLDGSLVLFEPDGRRAGAIDQNATWQPDPAAAGRAGTPFLDEVRQWIAGRGKAFLSLLIESLEEAMDNIHPTDRDGQTAFSVLMGRPMALVRLGVELELQGDAAFDLSWAELRRDLEREGRDTAGFEQVLFPYRLGEYRQLDDGLLGFWQLGADGSLGDALQMSDSLSAAVDVPDNAETKLPRWLRERNEAWKIHHGSAVPGSAATPPPAGQTLLEYLRGLPDNTVKKQDLIQPYVREGARVWDALVGLGWLTPEVTDPHIGHYADTGLLSLSAASARQEYLCLMDPFGQLHLSSGIQPVRSVKLSPGHVRDVLRRIEISFLTAPLLGPETPVRLSLPRLPEFTWSWEEKNGWVPGAVPPVTVGPDAIHPFQLTAGFPDRVVAREGRLVIRRAEAAPSPAEPPATGPEPSPAEPPATGPAPSVYLPLKEVRTKAGQTTPNLGTGAGGDAVIYGQPAILEDPEVGKYMRFSDDGLELAPQSTQSASDVTVAFWLRCATPPSSGARILDLSMQVSGPDSYSGSFSLRVLTDAGRVAFQFEPSSGTLSAPQVATWQLAAGRWTHVAATWSSEGVIKVFVDAVEKASYKPDPDWAVGEMLWDVAYLPSAWSKLLVGRAADPGSGPTFTGDLTHLRIYDRVLEVGQISDIRAADKAQKDAPEGRPAERNPGTGDHG